MGIELFLSVILASLGVFMLIGYFIAALFARIMFDMLGVKKSLAFIPIYNTYRIYKEYKGRVWKKNWGVAYLFVFLLPVIMIFLMIIIGIIMSKQDLSDARFLYSDAMAGAITVSLVTSILSLINVLLGVVLYLPIFETKVQKAILIINLVLSILSPTTEFIENTTYSFTVTGLSSLMGIVFLIFYFSAATTMRYKVKSGEYVLQEKLDYTILSDDEIKDILKQRGRLLAVPNKDNKVLNSDEFKVDRIEYI